MALITRNDWADLVKIMFRSRIPLFCGPISPCTFEGHKSFRYKGTVLDDFAAVVGVLSTVNSAEIAGQIRDISIGAACCNVTKAWSKSFLPR